MLGAIFRHPVTSVTDLYAAETRGGSPLPPQREGLPEFPATARLQFLREF